MAAASLWIVFEGTARTASGERIELPVAEERQRSNQVVVPERREDPLDVLLLQPREEAEQRDRQDSDTTTADYSRQI